MSHSHNHSDGHSHVHEHTHSHGDGGEHSHEGLASYTWLDPTLAIAQAEAIAAAILARDLAEADEVEARLAKLTSDLTTLDATARDVLQDVQNVAMIATHPRYQYFAHRYGLSIAALEWDAGALPSDDDFADLAAIASATNAAVLIWEAEPPRDAIAQAEALGLKSVVFEPGAGRGAQGAFMDAFAKAVADIGAAAGQASN